MNYKEFDGWKLAAELSKWVYYFTRRLPSSEEFGLLHQLIRAAFSILSSVAEGVGLKSSRRQPHSSLFQEVLFLDLKRIVFCVKRFFKGCYL